MTKPCYSLDGVQNPRYCHGTRKVDSLLNWYPFIVALLASLLLIDYQLNVIQYMIVCSVINRHLFYPHMPTKLSSRIHTILAIQHNLNSHHLHLYSPAVLSTQCLPTSPLEFYQSYSPRAIPTVSLYLSSALATKTPHSVWLALALLLQHIVSIANN